MQSSMTLPRDFEHRASRVIQKNCGARLTGGLSTRVPPCDIISSQACWRDKGKFQDGIDLKVKERVREMLPYMDCIAMSLDINNDCRNLIERHYYRWIESTTEGIWNLTSRV